MKNIINKLLCIGLGLLIITSCSDFEATNTDPHAANETQVRPEYAFNKSLYEAQQDPYYGERVFVLTWKALARQHRYNGNATLGASVDEWEGAIFSGSSTWQNYAKTSMDLADYRMTLNTLQDYEKVLYPNMKQAARIWKAYLLSGILDQFGTAPLNAFEGGNPTYGTQKEGYYFILDELAAAVSFLETSERKALGGGEGKYDIAYGFDFDKWVKFGNSIRMRLAMRLSEVDPQKAKTEFEAAVKSGKYIASLDDNLSVAEKDGWGPLSGVMSRTWNGQPLSATLSNLYIGLGGVKSADQLADSLHQYIKPADYIGERYENHYSLYTNDPMAGFWFDGLYNTMDPRAYATFHIPGDWSNPQYCIYPEGNANRYKHTLSLLKEDKETVLKDVNAKFTWNAAAIGNHGDKGAVNQLVTSTAAPLSATPRMVMKYRKSENRRIFFASWESYLLIAEASLRGWTVPMAGKVAYEKGIEESFKYHNVEKYLSSYLASSDYNNVGTSVSWDHVAEPPVSVPRKMKDGYTGEVKTFDYKYPTTANTLYGKALNDLYVKIITQKYIANMPWDPMEAWSDQRRLGLPFFETPAVELPLANLSAINKGNVLGKQQVNFFPQRSKFPAIFKNNNSEGYNKAVEDLGGEDIALTPLWWAKQK